MTLEYILRLAVFHKNINLLSANNLINTISKIFSQSLGIKESMFNVL